MNNYFAGLIHTLGRLPAGVIQQVIDVLHEARLSKRTILIMGNGGSASTATHFAADLSKNTYNPNLPSFRALSLSDNVAVFSAYANDEGYETVYERQVAAFANEGDVVIAISASGNSMNVVNALVTAQRIGAITIGFTGFTGGKVGKLVDIHLHVPNTVIEQVEDIHLLLEHLICKNLRENVDVLTGRVNPIMAIADDMLSLGAELPAINEIVVSQLMHDLSGGIENLTNLRDLLRLSLQLTLEGTGADSGSIIVLDETGSVVNAAIAYEQVIHVPGSQELADLVECGLAGWVYRNRQAALIQNTRNDPRWVKRAWDESGECSRSAISVPLLGQEGVSGVLTLVNSGERQFNQGHLVLLLAFSTLISYGKKSLV